MKRLIFVFTLGLLCIGFGWAATYSENFDTDANWSGGTMVSYNAKAYASSSDPANDGFSSNSAVREVTETHSAGFAWRVNTGAYYFRYECSETVNGFSMYLARWDNSPVPSFVIRYSLDSGGTYTDIQTLTGTWFTSDKEYKQFTHTFSTPINPTSGNKIYIEVNKTTGERLLIDDFSLEYGSAAPTPAISVAPSSLSGFYYTEGSGPSQEQSFTVSGTNLTANISVDAPTNYQISLGSGGSFSPQDPITLTQSGGSVAETTIYVRLASGLNAGGYNNETITASSSGATDQTVTCNGVVLKSEPTDHVTSFTAGTATASTIPLTWTDAAKVTPDGYLIKGSDVGYGSIVDPSDGSAESDGPLVHNVAQGNQSYTFSGLSPLTTYYFKIYPYTNSGANIDYKVSGTIPQATATTLGSSSLSPGDIAIIAFQVDAPDQFAFITFVNISAGTEIHFTDNGWTDAGTLNNTEGTVTWTAPASKDLAMGEIVVVTSGSPWTADNGSVSTSGSPAFATAGDQLIAYQGTSASPTLLYALSTTPWVESGAITSNTTYLPTGLVDGTTAIDFPTEVDNQYYNVTPITGTPAQVLASIGNPSNWERSDSYLTIPEWEVGTLPIELSSFTATIDAHNYVQLTWVTQSETNVRGFYVFRSAMNDLSTAELISPMVAATNTSQQQFYTYTDTELFVDGLYYYWLQNSDMDGSSNYHGPVHVSYSANGTNNGSPEIPTLTELKAIYPNPFNPIAYIPYSIASRSNVDIAIYNSRGQLVRSFALGTKETGSYRLEWNGMDNNGKACTTGVYYVRMTAGNDSFIRKAVLMK